VKDVKISFDSEIKKYFSKLVGSGFEEVMINFDKNRIRIEQGSKDRSKILQLIVTDKNENVLEYSVKKPFSVIVHDINMFVKYLNLFSDVSITYDDEDMKIILHDDKKKVNVFLIDEQYFDKTFIVKKDVDFKIKEIETDLLKDTIKSYSYVSAEYMKLFTEDGVLKYRAGERDVIEGVIKKIDIEVPEVFVSNEFIEVVRNIQESKVDMNIDENMVSIREEGEGYVFIGHVSTVTVEI